VSRPDLYGVLGVGKDADSQQIKRAYKKLASKAHPDKPGGSAEAMMALNQAHDVLSDPERRRRYDQDGDTTVLRSEEETARNNVVSLLNGLVNDSLEDPGDLIDRLRQRIAANTNQLEAQLQERRAKIASLEKRRNRLNGPFVQDIVNGLVMNAQTGITTLERSLRIDALMLKLLEEYSDNGLPLPDIQFVELPQGIEAAMQQHMQGQAQNYRQRGPFNF
jgi:curved DNA-binding protein CbpA